LRFTDFVIINLFLLNFLSLNKFFGFVGKTPDSPAARSPDLIKLSKRFLGKLRNLIEVLCSFRRNINYQHTLILKESQDEISVNFVVFFSESLPDDLGFIAGDNYCRYRVASPRFS
jgi:hypothetical protein